MSEAQAAEPNSDTLLSNAAPQASSATPTAEPTPVEPQRPDWLLEKYKSAEDQAKAYPELQKLLGGFTGKPKDGYAMPEGVDEGDELYGELVKFAEKTNMSQEAMGEAWELLSAQAEASTQVSLEAEKAKLGDEADARIAKIDQFLVNNLSADKYEEIKGMVVDANSVMLIESLIGTLAPARLPKDGQAPVGGVTQEDVEKMMTEKDGNGRVIYHYSAERQKKVQDAIARMTGG